jgi:predicted nucleic acid-binding protein
VVSNATAIIHLSRINKLSLLRNLFSKVIIPRAVYSELAVPGEVGCEEIMQGVKKGWIIVKDIRDRTSTYELAALLHKGEAEAIILAEEVKADYLIVDERVARHIAASRKIKVIGILGILSLCVKLNIININEALRLSQALIESGYIVKREVYEEWRKSIDQH